MFGRLSSRVGFLLASRSPCCSPALRRDRADRSGSRCTDRGRGARPHGGAGDGGSPRLAHEPGTRACPPRSRWAAPGADDRSAHPGDRRVPTGRLVRVHRRPALGERRGGASGRDAVLVPGPPTAGRRRRRRHALRPWCPTRRPARGDRRSRFVVHHPVLRWPRPPRVAGRHVHVRHDGARGVACPGRRALLGSDRGRRWPLRSAGRCWSGTPQSSWCRSYSAFWRGAVGATGPMRSGRQRWCCWCPWSWCGAPTGSPIRCR